MHIYEIAPGDILRSRMRAEPGITPFQSSMWVTPDPWAEVTQENKGTEYR